MITRRQFLSAAGATACSGLLRPGDAYGAKTTPEDLIARAMAGIDPDAYLDVHNHVVGMGHGGTGVTVHPHMTAGLAHPLNWIRFRAYIKASGITDMDNVDANYMAVLKARVEAMPTRGTSLLMAFDQVHDESGEPHPEHTVFSVPNDHMFNAVKLSERFAPCASVHPYRSDAVEALHAVADRGAVAIKWLPNAMHIDPASPLCTASYRVMAERGLTLISHGGEESAVPSPDTQELGNPLRLRAALDAGVTVVVAHSASHGHSLDLDDPNRPRARAFDLFMRMMDDPQYNGRLYGEISAVLLFNRVSHAGPGLMARTDLHHRLVNGSDYPIPGINPLINLTQLWSLGLIRWEDKRGLSSLFRENPLLGDFVLKRVLCGADGEPTGFPPSVFCPSREIFPSLSAHRG